MIRGEPAIGRDQSREPCLYSVEPVRVPTMKQSYASAGKAPRRRVHSLSGIAAIAECGLPPSGASRVLVLQQPIGGDLPADATSFCFLVSKGPEGGELQAKPDHIYETCDAAVRRWLHV